MLTKLQYIDELLTSAIKELEDQDLKDRLRRARSLVGTVTEMVQLAEETQAEEDAEQG
jgi:hypothetical protein